MRNKLKKAIPTIMTCLSAVGVVATAVLAVRETPKALQIMDRASQEKGEELTVKECIQSTWKCYIPAAAVGTATILCTVGSNVLNKRQQAALSGALMLTTSAYSDYQRKLKELYGQEAHDEIIKALTVEKAEEVPISANGGFYTSSLDFENAMEEKRLFYDRLSERYLESTLSRVLQAEYHLNRNMCLGGEVSLNDFYDFLGLSGIDGGDKRGWFVDDQEIYWIDFNHVYSPIDDGIHGTMDCWIIDPVFDPRLPDWS